jgi:hypothetical protein
MRRLPILATILVAAAAFADAPPPPPVSNETASAWACTKKTLLDDVGCMIEGKTQAQPPSKEQAKENQRQAQSLAEELCRTIATGESTEPDVGVLAACNARIAAATKKCGGDGSRRLLDDGGRFNPGHAKCYGALAELAKTAINLADEAGSCCQCVHDSCGGNQEQCVARMADEKAPEPSSCIEGACAAQCGQARIYAGAPAKKAAK